MVAQLASKAMVRRRPREGEEHLCRVITPFQPEHPPSPARILPSVRYDVGRRIGRRLRPNRSAACVRHGYKKLRRHELNTELTNNNEPVPSTGTGKKRRKRMSPSRLPRQAACCHRYVRRQPAKSTREGVWGARGVTQRAPLFRARQQ